MSDKSPRVFPPDAEVIVTLPGHKILGNIVERTATGTLLVKPAPVKGKFYPEIIEVDESRVYMKSKKNPPGKKTDDHAGDEMPLIYGRLFKMTMQKTSGRYDGEKFFHDFKKGATAHGLPAGSVVTLPSGTQVRLERRCLLLQSPHDLWGHYL